MKILNSAVLAITLGLLSTSAQALFINGSFETASINPATSSTGARTVCGTQITGWTASCGLTVDYMADGAFGPTYGFRFTGLTTPFGQRFVDLTGSDRGMGFVSQPLLNTAAGATYVVGFDIGGTDQFGETGVPQVNIDISGLYNVFAGSRTLVDAATRMSWTHHEFSFIGTGGDMLLKFTGVGTPLCCVVGLDNVTVTKLPEPGTLSLLAIGLTGIVWIRRRKIA